MTVRVIMALAVLGIAGLLFSGCEPAVPENYIHVTVEDIVESPNDFVGDFVWFDASVSNLNKHPDGNFYYIAQGEYGKALNVNTTGHPKTKLKYRIWGGVRMAADSYLPVLVETDREAWVPWHQNPVIIGVLIAVVVAVVILLTVQLTRRQPDPYGADEWEKPPVAPRYFDVAAVALSALFALRGHHLDVSALEGDATRYACLLEVQEVAPVEPEEVEEGEPAGAGAAADADRAE